MKKGIICLASLLLMFGFGSSSAYALGIGVYASGGGGSADWDEDTGGRLYSGDTTHMSYGLAFDTNLAKEKLFSYQLNIGYLKLNNEFSDVSLTGSRWSKLDMDGVAIANDFGFGMLTGNNMRIWIGPELRLAWLSGKPEGQPQFDIDLFGVGIGVVLGANFNLPGVTIGAKAGYLMMEYNGEGSGNVTTTGYEWTNYNAEEKMVYVGVTVFFRTSGDR